MNPQQPTPQPNPYSFITDTQHPKKGLQTNSPIQRFAIFAVLILLLIVVILLFVNFLGAAKRRSASQLVDLVAYQTELARVVNLGSVTAQTPDVKGRANTAYLTLQSDSRELTSYLALRSIKISPQTQHKYQFKDVDTALNDAAKNDTFDEVYKKLFDQKLADYQKQLVAAYTAQKGNIIRQDLRAFNAHAKLLYFVSPVTN